MATHKIKSYAKINLALNIVGKTSSIHKIETIVGFIDLFDDILIEKIKSKKNKVEFVGKFSKSITNNNTVTKLLNILEKKKLLKGKKFKIRILKRIPVQAGLGGGSMNAASILRYFIKKKIIKISTEELRKICNLIGSDVILGINPKFTILNTRHKIIRYMNIKKIYTLLIKPKFGCSTKAIYSKVKKFSRPKFLCPSRKMFDLDFLNQMNNSLEHVAFLQYPKLRQLKFSIEKLTSPIFVRMTGSGSTLVAYFASKKVCENAKKNFYKKYKNYWCIASKTI